VAALAQAALDSPSCEGVSLAPEDAVDPISGEELGEGGDAYVLDGDKGKPLSEETLRKLYMDGTGGWRRGANPFTNIPLKSVTRIRVVRAPAS
jgi:hypothetical protein